MNEMARMIFWKDGEAVCLKAGGYEALLAPQLGCNCFHLVQEATGASLVRTPDDLETLRENPNVYGTPLLFPPNRIKDGTYTYEGYTYHLPINENHGHHMHGFISSTAFEVMRLEAKEGSARAVFRYRSTREQPYLSEFPHEFTIEVTDTLTEAGLTQRVKITNDGARRMPVGVGFHTTLNAPFLPDGKEEDIRLILTTEHAFPYDERIIPTGEVLDDDPLLLQLKGDGATPCKGPISIHLDQTGGKGYLRDVGEGWQIEYTVDPQFRFWMLWNMDAKHRFMCPEPQTWMIDAPNRPLPPEKSGLRGLSQGESMVLENRLALTRV